MERSEPVYRLWTIAPEPVYGFRRIDQDLSMGSAGLQQDLCIVNNLQLSTIDRGPTHFAESSIVHCRSTCVYDKCCAVKRNLGYRLWLSTELTSTFSSGATLSCFYSMSSYANLQRKSIAGHCTLLRAIKLHWFLRYILLCSKTSDVQSRQTAFHFANPCGAVRELACWTVIREASAEILFEISDPPARPSQLSYKYTNRTLSLRRWDNKWEDWPPAFIRTG